MVLLTTLAQKDPRRLQDGSHVLHDLPGKWGWRCDCAQWMVKWCHHHFQGDPAASGMAFTLSMTCIEHQGAGQARLLHNGVGQITTASSTPCFLGGAVQHASTSPMPIRLQAVATTPPCADTKTLFAAAIVLTCRVWSSMPLPEKPSVCNGVCSKVSLLVFKTLRG